MCLSQYAFSCPSAPINFMLMSMPACLAHVTWKAVKQLGFSHWMHAPTRSLHSEQWSFHRLLGTFSTPSTGSMYMALPTPNSGIHIAQSKCDHRPVVVCLNAPPSLGQNRQDCG